MASTETDKPVDPEAGKPDPEAYKPEEPAPPPPAPAPAPPCNSNYFGIDVGLRALLFSSLVVALVVMATAEQTEVAVVGGPPVEVKFDQSPAFIYFVAALTVASLYSLLTAMASFGIMSRPDLAKKFLLHFAVWDVLMLGVVAAATGTAGSVAYIGLKGDSHHGWSKVCPVYDKFCQHLGSSIGIALFASVLLVLLIFLSVFSLHSLIRD